MTTYFTHDHPAPTEEKPDQHLNVEVCYSAVGVKSFGGRERCRQRGVNLSMRLMDITVTAGGMESRAYFLFDDTGAQNFQIATMARQSLKIGAAIADFVSKNKARIIDAGLKSDWPAVERILREIPAHDLHGVEVL